MKRSLPRSIRPRAMLGLSLAIAVALSGISASQAQTSSWTTLGTRTAPSQPSVPVTSNANASWSDYNPAEPYPNTVTLPLQYITMADGTKLAALVTLPADASGKAIPGPLPTILQTTDYNVLLGQDIVNLLGPVQDLASLVSLLGAADPYIVKHGYAVVAVDGTGTGNSGGVWDAWGATTQGYYAQELNWVTAQPWSNGKLGLYGTSDVAIQGLFSAEKGNPAVKGIFAIVPMGDSYRDTMGTGGETNILFITVWLALTTAIGTVNPQILTDPLQAIPLLAQHLGNALTDFQLPVFIQALLADPTLVYDGDFWATRSPLVNAGKITAPTFIVGGNHDLFQRGEPLLYETLKHNVPTKLLVGGGAHAQTALGLQVTGDGVPALNHIALRWFDQYVKGLAVGADTLPNVTQYVVGYDHLVPTTDWPHVQAQAQRWYLHGNAGLSTQTPGLLELPRLLLQTPLNGLCSISSVQWTLGALGFIPLPCFNYDNTTELFDLVYETPVLGQDMYFNGPIQANIWASTTNLAAVVSVRVDDVDPLGLATPISNGLLSAQLRQVDAAKSRSLNGQSIQPWHDFTQASAQPVIPGMPMLLPVEIFPTAALIKAGHKLRVAIGPSNAPQGIGTGLQGLLQSPLGVMTVYNDAVHPSSIVLPIVPASVLGQ